MTNAEKYLKDHIIFSEFANDLAEYIVNSGRKITDKHDIKTETLYFLTEETKPILTEDEKIILKNVNGELYQVIGRDDMNDLYFDDEDHIFLIYVTTTFGHLFQFIKRGQEYKIKDLLGG